MNTALALAHASEFRFVYWDTPSEYRFYTVRRGHGSLRQRWAVWDGGAYTWNGTRWCTDLYGEDAYRWDLDAALGIADLLAREMNLVIVHQMEKKFPGRFKGGAYDMAAQEERHVGE